MGLIVGGKEPFKTPIQEGQYLGICVGIADLGTQYNAAFDKDQKMLSLIFELSQTHDDDGFPQLITFEATQSMDDRANLCQRLTQWRGKKFSKEEREKFDVSRVLGIPGSISVIHGSSQKSPESVYANINAILPLMPGQGQPTPMRAPFLFDLDAPGIISIPTNCPSFIAMKVLNSAEWKARIAAGTAQPCDLETQRKLTPIRASVVAANGAQQQPQQPVQQPAPVAAPAQVQGTLAAAAGGGIPF